MWGIEFSGMKGLLNRVIKKILPVKIVFDPLMLGILLGKVICGEATTRLYIGVGIFIVCTVTTWWIVMDNIEVR